MNNIPELQIQYDPYHPIWILSWPSGDTYIKSFKTENEAKTYQVRLIFLLSSDFRILYLTHPHNRLRLAIEELERIDQNGE